jgi:hypothetical protein
MIEFDFIYYTVKQTLDITKKLGETCISESESLSFPLNPTPTIIKH